MKNQKSLKKYLGRVMAELRELPTDLQELALYHLHIRIKELKDDQNYQNFGAPRRDKIRARREDEYEL